MAINTLADYGMVERYSPAITPLQQESLDIEKGKLNATLAQLAQQNQLKNLEILDRQYVRQEQAMLIFLLSMTT